MNHQKIRELVIMGILAGAALVGQVALGFLPNIEVVTLLFIVYTLVFGKKVFFIIYTFVMLEGLLYGFGLWWVNYLYVWSIQVLVTLCFRKQTSVVFWSILSGFYGISFGALCAVLYLFIGGPKTAHCIGNVVLCLILYRPIRSVLERSVRYEGP